MKNIENMEIAIDPYTQEEFVKTRSNQVYANRENQIKHNNLKAREKRQALSAVNNVLHENLKVLQKVLGGEKQTIKSHEYLLGAGFNFGCITHLRQEDENQFYCVFNYGYRKLNTTQFEIKAFDHAN